MNATVTPMQIDHLSLIEHATDTIASVAATAPLDLPVPSCPGWDLRELVDHTGRVHGWATQAVLGGGERPRFPSGPSEGEDLVAWYRASAADLLEALRTTDPEAPVWSFTGLPATTAFWVRRQAHEATMHCWDAQSATGQAGSLDAAFASDGVDEYLSVFAWRRLGDGYTLGGSLHLHCTDTDGEWNVTHDADGLHVTTGHAKGDAALRGPASTLLRLHWGRASLADEGIETFGDRGVIDRWLALGAP
jgi:uncharacterized protein (TIGR03083 family)